MSLLFYNLAKNQDVQDRLYQEIMKTLPEDGILTDSSLDQMSYVKACLKESFRMHFPTPFGSRRILGEDTILKNYRIPKGVSFCLFSNCFAFGFRKSIDIKM